MTETHMNKALITLATRKIQIKIYIQIVSDLCQMAITKQSHQYMPTKTQRIKPLYYIVRMQISSAPC